MKRGIRDTVAVVAAIGMMVFTATASASGPPGHHKAQHIVPNQVQIPRHTASPLNRVGFFRQDVPEYLQPVFQDAVRTFRAAKAKEGQPHAPCLLPPEVLAGHGKYESDFGRLAEPGVSEGQNSAGAMGFMQFLAATFRQYGVDGDQDQIKNVYDPLDAIPSAAHLLCDNSRGDAYGGDLALLPDAMKAYNNAWWYVRNVLYWAKRYGGGLILDPRARTDWNTPGVIDPRIHLLVEKLSRRYVLGIKYFRTGHCEYVNCDPEQGRTNHADGRAVDIYIVSTDEFLDTEQEKLWAPDPSVGPDNSQAREIARWLQHLPDGRRPTEVIQPFVNRPAIGFYVDGDHQDHIHIGFDL